MNFMLTHCIAQSHWTYFSGVPKIFTWLHQIAIKLFRVLPPTKELLGILILRSKSINLHSADWFFFGWIFWGFILKVSKDHWRFCFEREINAKTLETNYYNLIKCFRAKNYVLSFPVACQTPYYITAHAV